MSVCLQVHIHASAINDVHVVGKYWILIDFHHRSNVLLMTMISYDAATLLPLNPNIGFIQKYDKKIKKLIIVADAQYKYFLQSAL